jgi:hypothetical protein
MTEKKTYAKLGESYTPSKKKIIISEDEVKGNYWRVWLDKGKYFYEFDSGHFATTFTKIEISKEDFLLIKAEKMKERQLKTKYK